MAKYIVVEDFTDLEDEDHVYRAGHKYPRKGRAKKERVEELSSTKNKQNKVLIKEVDEDDKG